MLEHPPLLTVLFDEAHCEAWTIRPELAERMQPGHPGDSSLALAAAALRGRDFGVEAHAEGALTAERLAAADVLVIAHPSDPKWEKVTGAGSPTLTEAELDAITDFVGAGGGLLVLAEEEQEKYGANLNQLLGRFGLGVENSLVQDYERSHRDTPSWVLAELDPGQIGGSDPLARIGEVCLYRAGTLAVGEGAHVLARSSASASPAGSPLAALVEHGDGRVAVISDSDLFGDDCIGELDHEPLLLNLVYWLARRRFEAPRFRGQGSSAASEPAWQRLRDAVEELRAMQAADGSIEDEQNHSRAASLVAEMVAASSALEPRFPHQGEYLAALRSDLEAWVRDGFARPDFIGSVEAFRPERDRRDGVEHLVVFPMYKQNASTDTCFEALIVRVPWPQWLAELEAGPYDNAKYVPVTFVDFTSGYDSECATLFPETFATAGRPPSHFGAIFCDREAERLRRVASAAADVLRLNLPPDAAALLASPQLSQDAYMLWDLIHDRTHMRGDLPFDPFMIRQRSPFWMYALEELRCDLTTFGEAVKLEQEGFAFARHAQYAIVFDRIFRFPLTGSRVRNYDGLGGQLLFAFLHHGGYLHWTDNRLTIEWERLSEGVAALREQVDELYHSGIDRSKLGQWIAAHDLVATYVPAAEGSRWVAPARDLPEVEEPKQLVDLVRDDEFPLSLFYTQLQPKLEPFLRRPDGERRSALASAA